MRAPNGPAMSSATSIFFTTRRDNNAGLIREMISLSGNAIWRTSFSVPELTNNPGRAPRSSPKVILTEPLASCERTLSTGMEISASVGGVCASFARKSMGNPAMMDARGNCRPFEPAPGAADGGAKTSCGLGCGAAADDERCGSVTREAAAGARKPDGATTVAPFSSKRRSSPRSKPANFDFTMFDMAKIRYIRLLYKKQDALLKQEPCHDGQDCRGSGVQFTSNGLERKFCPVI